MKSISEGTARTIDAICKIVTAIALVAGGWFALFQYFGTRQAENITRNIELKKPFLEKRLEVCMRATEDSGIVATSTNSTNVAKAKEDFLSLSWGTLVVVQDSQIEASMKAVRTCINDDQLCSKPLKDLSSELAKDCSEAIQTEWGVPRRPTLIDVSVQ